MLNSGTIVQNESKKDDLFEEEENPIINKLEEEVKNKDLVCAKKQEIHANNSKVKIKYV